MVRKWRLWGALASVCAMFVVAPGGTGGLIGTAYAWDMSGIGAVPVSQLPAEAQQALQRIAAGGPYPYAKDGVVFGNYERILPWHRRGYYHEYTVPTPYGRNRGARRIVCGGPLQQVNECYYSDDHYSSFRHIVE